MYLGTGLALTNWLSALIISTAGGVAYLYRVRVEEQALQANLGGPLSGLHAANETVSSVRFLTSPSFDHEISTPKPTFRAWCW